MSKQKQKIEHYPTNNRPSLITTKCLLPDLRHKRKPKSRKALKRIKWRSLNKKSGKCNDTCGENRRMAYESRNTATLEETVSRHSSWARNLDAGDRFLSTHYQKARWRQRIWGSKANRCGVDQVFDEMRMFIVSEVGTRPRGERERRRVRGRALTRTGGPPRQTGL